MARYLINDRTARPVYGIPDTDPIPPGVVEVDETAWNAIMAGTARYYRDADNRAMKVTSMTAWLPDYSPGAAWIEITAAEYDALVTPIGDS